MISINKNIVAPHMHAYILERLRSNLIQSNATILDIGCGSGYLLAVFARLNKDATIYGIETVPELVDRSIDNIRKADNDLLDRIQITVGNGWTGHPNQKFDCIHVGAACSSYPLALLDQLKIDGRLLVPIGSAGDIQMLTEIKRISNKGRKESQFIKTDLFQVQFVTLINKVD